MAWGHRAEHVIGLVDGVVVLAPGPAAQSGGPTVSRGANLADEPRDTVIFDGVPVTARAEAPDEVTEQSLWERTALGRAALMAGAVSAVAAMTLRYSREREQFGRPIGRFQAVQAHLVTIHQQATVVASAIDGAVAAVELGRGGFEIACAKMLADRAATAGDRGRPSDAWRNRNDEGVPVALSDPSALGLARRSRRASSLGGPARRGVGCLRSRRPVPSHPVRVRGGPVNRLQRPDGVTLAFQVHNPQAPGVPLLLTHGFGATAGMWDRNVDALSVDRPVIVWDQRGHGSSDAPDDMACYTEQISVADMAAILDAAGVDRAVLGGMSLGRLPIPGLPPRPSAAGRRAGAGRHGAGLPQRRSPRQVERVGRTARPTT